VPAAPTATAPARDAIAARISNTFVQLQALVHAKKADVSTNANTVTSGSSSITNSDTNSNTNSNTNTLSAATTTTTKTTTNIGTNHRADAVAWLAAWTTATTKLAETSETAAKELATAKATLAANVGMFDKNGVFCPPADGNGLPPPGPPPTISPEYKPIDPLRDNDQGNMGDNVIDYMAENLMYPKLKNSLQDKKDALENEHGHADFKAAIDSANKLLDIVGRHVDKVVAAGGTVATSADVAKVVVTQEAAASTETKVAAAEQNAEVKAEQTAAAAVPGPGGDAARAALTVAATSGTAASTPTTAAL
jgi:hypothetical protein